MGNTKRVVDLAGTFSTVMLRKYLSSYLISHHTRHKSFATGIRVPDRDVGMSRDGTICPMNRVGSRAILPTGVPDR